MFLLNDKEGKLYLSLEDQEELCAIKWEVIFLQLELEECKISKTTFDTNIDQLQKCYNDLVDKGTRSVNT